MRRPALAGVLLAGAVCATLLQIRLVHRIARLEAQLLGVKATLEGAGGEAQPGRADTVVRLEGAMLKGHRTAPLAIVEYADFECPFCGVFARETLPRLDRDYIQPGKVVFAFRHLPLERIHPRALAAAAAAECAARQDRFWAMHDALFARPAALKAGHFSRHAAESGLERSAFERCLGGPTSVGVQRDISSAAALGITSTPTFLVGPLQEDGRVTVARRITGAKSYSVFREILQALGAEPPPDMPAPRVRSSAGGPRAGAGPSSGPDHD